MSEVNVTFVGSGDAFGSGGRLQTCILVDAPGIRFAIDFGTSSLIGLRRLNVDPNSIDAIVLTHLHGDHCGGIPFLLLDAMLGAKRQSPLTILGPANTAEHLALLQAALFPGSQGMRPAFPLSYRELHPDQTHRFGTLTIDSTEAQHTRETHPLAVRVTVGDVSIAYTGDGALTSSLQRLVANVDLLIAECYFYDDKPVKFHLNYPDISHLAAKRVVLTHMHGNMLAQTRSVPEECAHDGYRITL